MVVSGKFSKALKILRRVATLNGKKEEGEKLSMEVGAERDYSLEQEPSSCLCFPAHKPTSYPMPQAKSSRDTRTAPPSLLPPAHQLITNDTPLLCRKELKFSMQKEISLAKAKYSIADLFRTPTLRRVTFCLSLAW